MSPRGRAVRCEQAHAEDDIRKVRVVVKPADAPGREAARTLVAHPEQGWSLLCNGVVLFDDSGGLLPGDLAVAPHPTAILT